MTPLRTTTYSACVLEDEAKSAVNVTGSNQKSKPSLRLRPMDSLIGSNRRNRYWWITGILILLSVAIVGLFWFWWYLHASPMVKSPELIQNDRMFDGRQKIADAALSQLNHPHVFHPIPNPCETTLLVIRHCDKLNIYQESANDDTVVTSTTHDYADAAMRTKKHSDRHCSSMGYERAAYLTTLFGSTPEFRYPIPKFLYALSAQRDTNLNYREWETLHPLAQMIRVNITVVDADAASFAKSYVFPLLQSGAFCGQTAIISWKHSLIPDLVNALACGPNNGCPMIYPKDSFDQIWQLKYLHQGNPTMISKEFPLHNDTDTSVMLVDQSESVSQDETVLVNPSDSTLRLRSKHHHRHHHHRDKSKHRNRHSLNDEPSSHWIVQGTVTSEMFDPLAPIQAPSSSSLPRQEQA
jgi:hypothetical protein